MSNDLFETRKRAIETYNPKEEQEKVRRKEEEKRKIALDQATDIYAKVKSVLMEQAKDVTRKKLRYFYDGGYCQSSKALYESLKEYWSTLTYISEWCARDGITCNYKNPDYDPNREGDCSIMIGWEFVMELPTLQPQQPKVQETYVPGREKKKR